MGRQYVAGDTCDDPAKAVPECFVFENWNGGWIGSYMNQVLKDLGVNVVALTKANFSSATKAASPASAFTRCVWEVKFGNVDLCVGDFWETPERRNLTTFTTPIDSDTFTLYTTRNPKAIVADFDPAMFMAIFLPFDNAVWLLFAIFIVAAAVVLRIVEGPTDPTEKRVIFAPILHHLNDSSKAKWAIQTFDDVLEGIWAGVMAFLGGEDDFLTTAKKWPGRIICVGLGVFVFVHVNTYTGNLAAYYVTNNKVQVGLVNSLSDIKSANGNLCLYQSMASATKQIITQAGIADSQLILMDNYGPMLEQLYEGACMGAVVGKFERRTFIAGANQAFKVCMDPSDTRHWTACVNSSTPSTVINLNPDTCGSQCQYTKRFCNLISVQDSLMDSITLSWEMPVRTDLEPWVSMAIIGLHTSGNLSVVQNREIFAQNPVVCSEPAAPSIAVGLDKLSGTFLICGGFVAIGLLVHMGMLTYGMVHRACFPILHEDREAGEAGAEGTKREQGKAAALSAPAASAPSDFDGVNGRADQALESLERLLERLQFEKLKQL